MSDIHKNTAARMFKIKPEEVNPAQRRLAKRRNFITMYRPEDETPAKSRALDIMWVAMYKAEGGTYVADTIRES